MDDRRKYLLILIGVIIAMVASLITVFAILIKSIQKIDQKINNKHPNINITILEGTYGDIYK